MTKKVANDGAEVKSRKKHKGDKKTPMKKAKKDKHKPSSDVEEEEENFIIYSDEDEYDEGEVEWETPTAKDAIVATKEKAEDKEETFVRDARADFRKDPAIIEAHRQYNGFVDKTNHIIKGTEKETAEKAKVYVNLIVAIEVRECKIERILSAFPRPACAGRRHHGTR